MNHPLKGKPRSTAPMPRLDTRVFGHQKEFVQGVVKKSKGSLGEGQLYRDLIDRGIISYKKDHGSK